MLQLRYEAENAEIEEYLNRVIPKLFVEEVTLIANSIVFDNSLLIVLLICIAKPLNYQTCT